MSDGGMGARREPGAIGRVLAVPDERAVLMLIDRMTERLASGNPVPVERAHVTRAEWVQFLEGLRYLDGMGMHGGGLRRGPGIDSAPCQECLVADSIDAALGRLKAASPEYCAWTRLPDVPDPLECRKVRFSMGCCLEVAAGAAPIYPDDCPKCGRPVGVGGGK